MGDRVSVRAGRPLRILHVSDCYTPRLGGIEVQLGELARTQAAAGHETHVVTATPGAPEPTGRAPQVHRVVAQMPFELPVHPRAARHVRRLLDALSPDVVHAHIGAISPFAWSAARVAADAGLPLVVAVHSMWDPVTSAVYRGLDVGCGWRRWRLVLAPVSEAAARPVRRLVGDRARVSVVPNGLDLASWRGVSGDHRPGGERRRVHVVAVGRLAPRKQPLTLLRLLRATAARSGPDAPALRATIVGDGPAEPAMRRYLDRHRMAGWVELPGRVARDELPELLSTADVFLAPAAREAFGLAALEARAAGVPVVARRRTGVADFVTAGRTGLLSADESGLVDALVRLCTDGRLRADLAARSRSTPPLAQSWPAVLAALDRCYARAGAGPTRAVPRTAPARSRR